MRKTVSLILTLALLLSLVPAALAESYNLDIYWIGNGDKPEIREGVEQAVNQYIEPIIGATVTFHIINWDEWVKDAIGDLEAGKKIDLFFTADWSRYSAEVAAGLLLPLDDLLDEYGWGITATLPRRFLNGVRVDGVLYGIPTNKELCVPNGFIINKTAAEQIGWNVTDDDSSITCTEDLEPWLEKYKQQFPDFYPYMMDGGQNARWADEPWIPDWVGVANNAISVKMAPREDGTFDETIYNIFETPEEEAHIRLMYRWAQLGYIAPEAYLDSFDYNGIFGRGEFLAFSQPLKGNNIKSEEMIAANATKEFLCTEITMQPKCIITTHAGGSMFAIPVSSQNPAKAMQYLNLMHSDAMLINLMLFGEEGVNYKKTAQMKLDLNEENSWYSLHGGAWTVGNTRLQYVLTNENIDKNALLQVYADDAVVTPSLGFRFQNSAVLGQVNAVNQVCGELAEPLLCGSVDPDDPDRGLEALRAALHEAGIDDIIAEVQRQYDAWRKDQ